jgi:hypothetical protein
VRLLRELRDLLLLGILAGVADSLNSQVLGWIFVFGICLKVVAWFRAFYEPTRPAAGSPTQPAQTQRAQTEGSAGTSAGGTPLIIDGDTFWYPGYRPGPNGDDGSDSGPDSGADSGADASFYDGGCDFGDAGAGFF